MDQFVIEQPMDQFVIETMKRHYKRKVLGNLLVKGYKRKVLGNLLVKGEDEAVVVINHKKMKLKDCAYTEAWSLVKAVHIKTCVEQV
ncbi:hypothetical protein QE152_g6860 [Popillia japonica]|uniref:Uncharacterized protein n=1 Tax=Popillia japonica TaxID=7064 RepID=A0AAW1MGJ3_POPJA